MWWHVFGNVVNACEHACSYGHTTHSMHKGRGVQSMSPGCMSDQSVIVPFYSPGAVANSVTLIGSTSDTEGYVMIFIGSSWKLLTVHSSYWTTTHAEVVCRQLGYEGGVVPSSTIAYRWVCVMYNTCGVHISVICTMSYTLHTACKT